MNRRRFLRGATGALLALPALPSLVRPVAAEPEPPRRFVAIKSYSSQRVIDWYPRFQGKGYEVRPFVPGNGKSDGSTICPIVLAEPHERRSDGRMCHGRRAPLTDLARDGRISAVLGIDVTGCPGNRSHRSSRCLQA